MLQGKVALITGTSRGIGRTIAETFAQQGAIVIANARIPGAVDGFVDGLKNKYKTEAYPVYFDVSNPEEVAAGFRTIFKITKKLDILVNNAGVIDIGLIGMVQSSIIKKIFSTNVFGTIYCAQFSSRLMSRKKNGSIINISSIIGCEGQAGLSVYSGSKAAVIGITKSLAKELAHMNIRVNAIAPGFIDTDMASGSVAGKDQIDEVIDKIKMKRIGTPEDVAGVALFLASDLSEYVTGQIIGVDGCMTI